MNPLIRFVHKLSILFRSGRFRRELDEEMTFHREQVEKELMAEGMSAEDSYYAAMRQFGDTGKLREQSQEAVAFRAETVAQDVRFALRQWARYPGFAFTAILILALGIGANTAIFSVVDAILLRPLPYRDSDRLVLVWQSSKEHRATGEWFNTYREFEEWKRNSRSFEKLVALTWAVSEKTWFGVARRKTSWRFPPASISFPCSASTRSWDARSSSRTSMRGAQPFSPTHSGKTN